MKRVVRSVLEAMGPPSARKRWMASMENVAFIHPTTEFNDRQPDESSVQIGQGSYFERDVTIWLSGDAGADAKLVLGERCWWHGTVIWGRINR